MNKYECVVETNAHEQCESTPPNTFQLQRSKRGREHDCDFNEIGFKEDIKIMISSLLAPQQDEMRKIHEAVMEIKSTNISIESSITHLATQNEELRKKVEKLEGQCKKDKEYITILEDKMEDILRGSRKSNIELKNVPKLPKETKEDLIKMVVSLSKTIGYNAEELVINDIYRVQSKRVENNSPIVAEFSSTIQRTEFIRMAKYFNIKHKEKLCGKDLGLTKHEYTPIYVSEQLTAKAARLHFLARDLTKSKGYKFCWTSYGKVYIRKNESSPIIIIKNELQVNNLMQED